MLVLWPQARTEPVLLLEAQRVRVLLPEAQRVLALDKRRERVDQKRVDRLAEASVVEVVRNCNYCCQTIQRGSSIALD